MDKPIEKMVSDRRAALGDIEARADAETVAGTGARAGVDPLAGGRTDGGGSTPRRPWGLALSGGGIRSATFCLGLLKALAQQGQLLRFDLLSTVSGGGYAGAVWGRLCDRFAPADPSAPGAGPAAAQAVQAAFADLERVRFGQWLRGNGRYLIPGGLGDMLFAAALFLRNLLATHIELAIAATLLGLVLGGIDLLAWSLMARAIDPGAEGVAPAVVRAVTLLPVLWSGVLLLGPPAVVLANAYWALRDGPRARAAWRAGAGLVAWSLCAAAIAFFRPVLDGEYRAPTWLVPAALGLALSWVCASLWVLWTLRRPFDAAAWRNRTTRWLSLLLRAALALGLLGLVDAAAWWLAQDTDRAGRAAGGLALAVAAAAVRAVLPLVASGSRAVPALSRDLMLGLIGLLGIVLSFCLVAWWVSVLYAALLLPVFTPQGLNFGLGGVWWWLLLLGVGGYALLSGRNVGFLNLSSLHVFYKARIVRAYLGAANGQRLGGSPIEAVERFDSGRVAVGETQADDDVAQHRYRPHLAGGPVHLVNVCVNHTLDSRRSQFNRDRKGLPMTVAPGGWAQAAGGDWQAMPEGEGALTLGGWTAVSGAALAPGLGRMTHRGVAALTLFAGLRLGYWWPAGPMAREAAEAWWRSPLAKTGFVLRECFGVFAGIGQPYWFLSDGGHFENTGAYALLQQEAELIVLADCGADPAYRFCDLENLVRCARIDFGADIAFMKPRPGVQGPFMHAFGSLNDLSSMQSQACLALARVRYASGRRGCIVLVKPNVSADLPVDLVNFKAAHPGFPQESTTDQFFSEAQWESYFQLGNEIGARLNGKLLDAIASSTALIDGFEPDDGQGGAAPAGTPAGGTWSRIQARVMQHGVVQASLGIGGVAALLLALWQGVASVGAQADAERKAQDAAVRELTDRWGRLRDAGDGSAAAWLAAELVRTVDRHCRPGEGGDGEFLRRGGLNGQIAKDALVACEAAPARGTPACADLLRRADAPGCLAPLPQKSCVPRYWARDYGGLHGGGRVGNCPELLSMPWRPVVVLADYAWTTATGGAATLGMARKPHPDAVVADAAAPAAAPPVSSVRGPVATRPTPGRSMLDEPSPAATVPAPVPVPVPAPAAPSDRACAGVRVYIQAFGTVDRAAAAALRDPWRALGASVPPIEDVLDSARRAGRAPPIGYAEATVLLPDERLRPCAEAMKQVDAAARWPGPWRIRPLPARLRASAGTVEVWLPQSR
ncbi:MAG: hypothetical protein J0I65_13570 [Variovorax sp.]|nr:hypothetical protein [Variovorax sp.]